MATPRVEPLAREVSIDDMTEPLSAAFPRPRRRAPLRIDDADLPQILRAIAFQYSGKRVRT